MSAGAEAVHVLFIDDDPGLGRLVGRALKPHGFTVIHEPSGAAGLARLTRERFDAVALDHYMPDQDGLEVLPEIRALPDAPPVIYVTGADEGRIAVAALKAGAVDYVIKDVGGVFLDLLRSAITSALEQVRLRRDKEAAEREMREARERAETLLREVNHRVANSLALVSSLVSLQERALGAEDAARAVLIETQTRIMAIAQIHRRLYTSEDVRFVEMDVYLKGLVEELEISMRPTGREHVTELTADPVRVTTDQAVAIGVIVTELVTNVYKYAYPQGVSGHIRVRLERHLEQLLLVVEDDGVGWSGTGTIQGSGVGTRIVQTMAASLHSSLTFDSAHAGTRVTLLFSP